MTFDRATSYRWRARIATVGLALTASTTLAVVTPVASADTVGDPPATENSAAGAAITALTTETPTRAAHEMPGDFDTVMGYVPALQNSMVINPHGSCSSPVTLPAEFDNACKAHDLGYDLLRYADHSGHQLGPWARKAIDAQLDRRMHAACETRIGETSRAGCFTMADIAASAVDANSWRQAYVSPRPELPVKLIAQGAAAGLTVLTLAFFMTLALAPLKRLRIRGLGLRAATA